MVVTGSTVCGRTSQDHYLRGNRSAAVAEFTMGPMQTTEPNPTIIEATIDRYVVMFNEADDATRGDLGRTSSPTTAVSSTR